MVVVVVVVVVWYKGGVETGVNATRKQRYM
jgi:hypothetical protein